MKTLTKTLAIVAAVSLIGIAMACSGEKKDSDSNRRQRTDIPADSIDAMSSADLTLAELKGPVEELYMTCTIGEWSADSVDTSGNPPYMQYRWQFDNRGVLQSIGAENIDEEGATLSVAKVTERDEQGHPVCVTVEYLDDNNQPLYKKLEKIDWSSGMPATRNFSDQYTTEKHENEYDKDGNIKTHEMIMHDGHEGYKQVDNYKYIRFDEHGNWTERYVRSLGMTVYFDGKGNPTGYGDSQKFFSVERREITYRQ